MEVEYRKRNKVWFPDNFFHLKFFETFRDLEIEFSINLSRFLWTAINNFEIMLLSG